MLAFSFGQIAQQLACRSVAGPLDGPLIVAPRFQFHDFDLLAGGLDAERTHEPHRLPLNEAFDVMTPQ